MMDKIPEIGQVFYISKFNPCGGTFDEPRLAIFWGKHRSGIRAMEYLDDEGGMEFVNSYHAHKYENLSTN